MIVLWLFLVLCVAVEANAAAPTTLYATSVARGGSDTAATCPSSPRCTVRRAIELANGVNGDIVSLESGSMAAPYIYSDAKDNILPGSGKSGASTSVRLTVRAEVEGGVIIDGQFVRMPVNLANGNSFWLLEGFNVRNGRAGAYHVIAIGSNSNNNVLRRIVAWDASINGNNNILGVHGNTGNVAEDIALFGPARKPLEASQSGNSFTCRRCWIRWEGTVYDGGRTATLSYKNYDMLCENCLFTWSGESQPQNYTSSVSGAHSNFTFPGAANAGVYTDRVQDISTACTMIGNQPWTCAGGTDATKWSGGSSTGQCSNGRVLGSIAYLKGYDDARHSGIVGGSSTNNPPTLASVTGTWNPTVLKLVDCFMLKDFISYVDPSHPQFSSANRKALVLSQRGGPQYSEEYTNVTNSFATNITTIGGTADTTGSGWQVSNLVHATLVANLPGSANPWTGTTGGQVCKRYENGTLTTTPLWPWPMNDRILAATGQAGPYNMTTGCVGCTYSGTGPRARVATDVTAEIENILGAIPAACKTSTTQTFPDATGFNPPLLSTF